MKFDEVTSLALLRTETKSSRSGIGWALIDAQANFIAADAGIAGANPERPIFSIKKNIEKLDHLYLTTEPFEGVFNVTKLTQLLEESNLTKITLGVSLPDSLALNQWRVWVDNWPGTVIVDHPNPVAERVNKGLSKFLSTGMPWVTCVSAASLTGLSLPLEKLELEFGFLNYLNGLLRGTRAVLYVESQANFLKEMDRTNSVDEELLEYLVSSLDHFAPLLRHCAREQCFHVVILCDMNSLASLIDQGITDEIVHHIAHNNIEPDQNEAAISNSLLNLKDWKLLNSEVVGNCNRIVLCKDAPIPLLRGGLN